MRILICFIMSFLLYTSANASTFMLKSSNITDGNMVPKLYTCDGKNMTPELHWLNPPANTQAFALVGLSYDSPMGKIFGWSVYNIPPTVKGFPAGIRDLPAGAVVGQNALGESSYRGPCPGDSALHHYAFILYALDSNPSLESDLTPQALMDDIKPHILQEAHLKAVYRH
ncbi:MAG: YbhB/YbcL family Raf kinase inhibitor-like protein [Pseudomonadota bacterium]